MELSDLSFSVRKMIRTGKEGMILSYFSVRYAMKVFFFYHVSVLQLVMVCEQSVLLDLILE